jgi:hypothetical protein
VSAIPPTIEYPGYVEYPGYTHESDSINLSDVRDARYAPPTLCQSPKNLRGSTNQDFPIGMGFRDGQGTIRDILS